MPTFFTVLVRAPRRRSFSSRLVRKSSAPSNRAPFSPVFRSIFPLLLIVTFFAVSPLFGGCAAPKTRLPEVVGEEPSFEELKAVVNANSAKIESIYSSDATIGAENAPGWATCQIAFERPGNLRVIGTALAMGRVVDVGCNDERFWFWSNFQNKEELYFCRHDQYQNSAAARVLPVDPTWFPQAFGVVELKDEELVDGPTRQADGSLLVTLKKTRPDGTYLQRVYFEPKTAAILRQDVQNPEGDAVVSIVCKRSFYVETPGVVLPQKIEISCPRGDGSLIVDVGTPILNDSSKIAAKAFEQPTDLKATTVDLGAATRPASETTATPAASVWNSTPTVANAAPLSNAQTVASASVAPTDSNANLAQLGPIRMTVRARVENAPQSAATLQAAAPTAQTFATTPTVANAQLSIPAPQPAQNAPNFQTPSLTQNAQPAQNLSVDELLAAPTLETADANATLETPSFPNDFPTLDVPTPNFNAPQPTF